MASLAHKKCVPCEGGAPPLLSKEIVEYAKELGNDWKVVNDHHIEKEFSFKNFKEALAFTNQIGAIAEEEGHHPDILLRWGKVKVTLWTHAVGGLSENDFILASKINQTF